MKFSYRVTAVVLLIVTVVFLYVSWKDNLFDNNPIKRSKLIDHHMWPVKVSHHRVIQDNEVCGLAQREQAQVDINTLDILKEMNVEEKVQSENEIRDYNTERQGPLEVIIVPHSHNDPGWLKTIESYFEDQTKHILNNMVMKLLKYPDMTFMWAETVFLDMWWKDLDKEMKQAVRRLVDRRQLEIVGGGWVVPDEANPHYFSLIDQMIEGHQWLEKNLGIKPRNVWTLDPFGYSSTHPYLYKRAGMEHMIILRVFHSLKHKLVKKKALEFKWRQPWDQSGESDMQVQMMPYILYNIKFTCGPSPEICLMFDFRHIPGEDSESTSEPVTSKNVESLAKLLLQQYRKKASLFRHNVVLIPLGDDFRYDRAIEWDQQYKNYKKLLNYMNSKKEWNVRARFGILQDYFDLMKKAVVPSVKPGEQVLPSLSGDFFPYSDVFPTFWTGYFTTRPFLKNLGREVQSIIRAAEILNSFVSAKLSKLKRPYPDAKNHASYLEQARRSLGLFQHHDAITGTARDFVASAYEDKLISSLKACEFVMKNAAKYLLDSGKEEFPHVYLDMDDVRSLKTVSIPEKIITVSVGGTDIIVYNSLAKPRQELVHLLVNSETVEVTDADGKVVPNQINPVWTEPTTFSAQKFELVFFADIPALAMTSYTLRNTRGAKARENYSAFVRLYNVANVHVPRHSKFHVLPPKKEMVILENQDYVASFSYRTGLLKTITKKSNKEAYKVNIQLLMYKAVGSGAYIFGPSGPAVDSDFSSRPTIRVIKGPLMSEVQVLQQFIQHTVRLCNTTGIQSSAFEIDNVVNLEKFDDKEIIMRFVTNITNSNDTFYSDLNGFQIVQRKRLGTFPTEGNYYPMTTMSYIEDEATRLSLLTGQPLGTSSLKRGWLEVMLDRRLAYDDSRGLGEGVQDNKRTPSRFFLVIEQRQKQPRLDEKVTIAPESSNPIPLPSLLAHSLSDKLLYGIYTFMVKNKTGALIKKYEPLSAPLPCDVSLVNLRVLKTLDSPTAGPTAALILHRRGFNCDFPTTGLQCTTNSGTIPLSSLFTDTRLKAIKEMTLSLMHERRKVELNEILKLKPMELYAFHLSFQ